MKKLIAQLNIIFVFLLVSINLAPSLVLAQNTADPQDRFELLSPAPNQKIRGAVNVSWLTFDDDRDAVPFTAEIYDRVSCKDNNFGSITPQTLGNSSPTSPNSINWNSTSTQSTPNLPDGEYCLRICAVYMNGTTDYSVCNGRPVVLINNNVLPSITSSVSDTTVYHDESWQYQLTANDPDGDTLTYRFIVSPNFLSINPTTGLITKNSNVNMPADVSYADYLVVVAADDNLSGYTTQTFTLRVVNRNYVAQSPTTNNPSPNTNSPINNGGNVQGVNKSGTMQIEFPEENSVLKGEENVIKWKAEDPDGIKEIKIDYSAKAENWIEVATLRGDTTEYVWDVSNIADGSYYLKFTIVDEKESVLTFRSPRFNILNNIDGDKVDAPLIINVAPKDSSSLEEVKTITGDFIASEGSTIDTESFEIKLNGEDISNSCEVSETDFVCTLEEILTEGKHEVEAKISDSSVQSTTSKWSFEIASSEDESGVVTLGGREFGSRTLALLTVICCLASILLLVPWIIYSMWKRNRDDEDYYMDRQAQQVDSNLTYPETVTYTDPYYYDPNAQQVPEVTTNYYYPDNSNFDYSQQLPVQDPQQPTTVVNNQQPDVNVNLYDYGNPQDPNNNTNTQQDSTNNQAL